MAEPIEYLRNERINGRPKLAPKVSHSKPATSSSGAYLSNARAPYLWDRLSCRCAHSAFHSAARAIASALRAPCFSDSVGTGQRKVLLTTIGIFPDFRHVDD